MTQAAAGSNDAGSMQRPVAGPLAGLKVVELGQVLAGPFAGAVFADLGADVIKIERPGAGDDSRHMGAPFRHGAAILYHVFNRNKHSVALDLKSPDGIETLHGLVADADVMLHNLRPGVAEELGIDGATMCARHPRLIYCEMSAFGRGGPLAGLPGYEPLIQAYSGLSSLNGDPDGPPIRIGPSICDQGTGMWVVIGALSLLARRGRTGRGGVVSASLLETALVWGAQKIDEYVNEGTFPQRHATGHPSLVPFEAFDGADGPFLICVGNDRLFAKFAAVVGHPEWASDPKFRTNPDRVVNKVELLGLIRAILRPRPRADWMAELEAVGVPCSPINSIPEAMAEPQVAALGILQQVPGEDFRLTGLPISFDGARPEIRWGAPALGKPGGR